MINSKVRVAKHRVEKSLQEKKFPTENNLKILIDAKVNIKPYIKQFKENIDLFIKEKVWVGLSIVKK